MSAMINSSAILKDLVAALPRKDLQEAVQDYGYELLEKELAYLVGVIGPWDRRYVIATVEAVRNDKKQSDKTAIKFKEVKNDAARERLQRAVKIFGVQKFYNAVLRVEHLLATELLDTTLKQVVRGTALKESHNWLAPAAKPSPSEPYKIVSDNIKNKETRDLMTHLIESYGMREVALRLSRLLEGLVAERLTLAHDTKKRLCDPLSAFLEVRKDINATLAKDKAR